MHLGKRQSLSFPRPPAEGNRLSSSHPSPNHTPQCRALLQVQLLRALMYKNLGLPPTRMQTDIA